VSNVNFVWALARLFKRVSAAFNGSNNSRLQHPLHLDIRTILPLPTMARLITAVLLASFALTAFAAQAEDIRLLNNRKMLWGGVNSE
jgi:hypothetical protein